MNSTLCAMYQLKEESCQHLFLECKHAQWVWSMCFKWICVSFVQLNDLNMHFLSFHLSQASNKQNLVWKGVWATVIKCIWDQRNLIVFKQGVEDAEEVFQKAELKSWLLMKHKVQSFHYSFVDWVTNPMICIGSYK